MEEKKENTSFIGHLEEVRWRLVRAAIAILVCAITIFVFIEPLTDMLLMSLSRSNFPTYRLFCYISDLFGLGDTMCAGDIRVKPIETVMTKQFATSIYFSLVGGIIILHFLVGFIYLIYKLNNKK